MLISVVNFTHTLHDPQVLNVIRAINRQIEGDFAPYWSLGATLRLEGPGTKADKQSPEELRGDAIIYLWDKAADVRDAIGYHDMNNRGLPYGFVFTEIAKEVGEDWSVTLSHEALELIGDPDVNLLAAGPSPQDPKKLVFFWYEMCDAVQSDNYTIDGVSVSNFVLPLYFTPDAEIGSRNDFLGTKKLQSFGVKKGGYVGYFDPATESNETFVLPGDQKAARRMKIKHQLGEARRLGRYDCIGDAVKKRAGRAAAAAAAAAAGKK